MASGGLGASGDQATVRGDDVRGPDRFKRMRDFERRVKPLTDEGWHFEDLTYEDKEGEPFRVYLQARLDQSDERDGVL